jgi:hypothetical protein
MSDLREQQNAMYEHLFQLEQPDRLGVLTSTREVVLRARLVRIEPESIRRLAGQLTRSQNTEAGTRQILSTPEWPERYHFFDGTERTVNWILLLDALNFCFWAEKGQARWQVTYQDEALNGYWAEAAALRRAVEEGRPLWDARYLSNMNHQELAAIFRGSSPDGPAIPLFEERLRAAREVGQVLLERFGGQFSHLVEQMGQSGVELALALARNFTSFRDVATYNNQEVRFLKRAQICVADLAGAFKGQSWGTFTDLDQLTIFADYKLPQVLRHYGALIYTPELAGAVDRQELLAAGGAEEREIRAATVWAGELLRRELTRIVERPVSAAEVDMLLWHLGQDAGEMRPYHRVRTIFY